MKKLPVHKDIILTGVLALLAVLAIASASFSTNNLLDTSDLKRQKLAHDVEILKGRDIIEYSTEGKEESALISYTYVGEQLPEKLTPDEVVGKRTESSFTRLLGYENKGTPQEKMILSAVIYPQQAFTSRGSDWYNVEYGETSKDAFDEAAKQQPLEAFFWTKAHAASLSAFSGAGDGYATSVDFATGTCAGSQAAWDATHDATSATSGVNSTAVTFIIGIVGGIAYKDPFCEIDRGFLPFDTSSLPASAVVTAATLSLNVAGVPTDGINDGSDYVTVVQTSQATHTTLANADYDMCGAINNPTEGIDSGQRKDITSITNGSTQTFTLNATGMSWVKKSAQASACSATAGITCLGVREGHDTTDTKPGTDSAGNQVSFTASEQTGTATDPVLAITYTLGSFAFWQFQDY